MEYNKYADFGLPVDYTYLNKSLAETQEHVFLINKKIADLSAEKNPSYETTKELAQLAVDKEAMIDGYKLRVENDIRDYYFIDANEVRTVVDYELSDLAYQEVKTSIQQSGKAYERTDWADLFLSGYQPPIENISYPDAENESWDIEPDKD